MRTAVVQNAGDAWATVPAVSARSQAAGWVVARAWIREATVDPGGDGGFVGAAFHAAGRGQDRVVLAQEGESGGGVTAGGEHDRLVDQCVAAGRLPVGRVGQVLRLGQAAGDLVVGLVALPVAVQQGGPFAAPGKRCDRLAAAGVGGDESPAAGDGVDEQVLCLGDLDQRGHGGDGQRVLEAERGTAVSVGEQRVRQLVARLVDGGRGVHGGRGDDQPIGAAAGGIVGIQRGSQDHGGGRERALSVQDFGVYQRPGQHVAAVHPAPPTVLLRRLPVCSGVHARGWAP
jgi:hypothetical protein